MFCCVDPPLRYQSREDEQAELGTLMEDPQAEKNFDDICMLMFLYVSLRWYHDAVEHTRISHAVDVFILMLTSADCMIQTTRYSIILFLKLNVFSFSTYPRLLETVRDILRPWDFRCWCRNMVLTDLERSRFAQYECWVVQTMFTARLGAGIAIHGDVFFFYLFLELECKTWTWTLWLAACSFFVFIFHVDWKSQFLIPAVAGQFGFGSLPVLFTDDRALQEMST